MEEVFAKRKQLLVGIPSKLYLPLALGCIGLILFVYGIWNTIQLSASRENSSQNSFSQASVSPKANTVLGTQTGSIKIDIEGAVVSPGVYMLSKDARVQDGLIASGGLSHTADRDYVAKHIDLASKLTDGVKLYIPKIGEQNVQVSSQADTSVNINSASANDLDSLPGVGPATAQKIISNRPYEVLDDLVTKKAVTQKVFDKIKDKISL